MTVGQGWFQPLPSLKTDVAGNGVYRLVTNMLAGEAPEIADKALGRRLFYSLIRLVDKTIMEYQEARSLCEVLATGEGMDDAKSIYSRFRAIDHIETCVGSLDRAMRHLVCIHRDKDAPALDRTDWRNLVRCV